MKELEFDTKVGEKELYHFLMRHFYTSFAGMFGVVLSVAALAAFVVSLGKREPMQLIILLLMASLFTVVQPIQMKLKAGQQIKKNPIFQEPLHYAVDEKGLKVSQNGESATIEWDMIRKVVETRQAFFVYMTVMNANVIPKKQLDDKQEDFKNWMLQKLDKRVCKMRKTEEAK